MLLEQLVQKYYIYIYTREQESVISKQLVLTLKRRDDCFKYHDADLKRLKTFNAAHRNNQH